MYYRDLREFLAELERRGKLFRFRQRINKDTELIPLMRVQLRGVRQDKRGVLLFENVTDAHGGSYDMRVAAGAYGASDDVVTLSMGCETPREALERWHQALCNPIPPTIVDAGLVHEEVHLGDDLQSRGLDELPIPVEEVGFSQMLRTGLPMITRDPTTGATNVGTYNGFFRDRDRLSAGIGGGKDGLRHWEEARKRGEDLPAAILIGCTPSVMLTASAALPYGMDEYAVAGGIEGRAIEMVRCKTIPLEVPATTEIVIEGLISTRLAEPRTAFGEYPGYMNIDGDPCPVMHVTAITHRKNALVTPVLVGMPPSDCNAVWSFVNGANLYHQLRYGCSLQVDDVYIPEIAGGKDWTLIRMEKGARPNAPLNTLNVAAGLWTGSKYLIAVDYDLDIRDPDMVVWALSYRVKPESDIIIQRGRSIGLDPAKSNYRVLIDATKVGVHPPVALPQRQYMERALEIWREQPGLPEAHLHDPWYGYSLGVWTEQDQELADLITAGNYREVGRRVTERQGAADELVGLGR